MKLTFFGLQLCPMSYLLVVAPLNTWSFFEDQCMYNNTSPLRPSHL